jgi:hypothetical protein
LSKHCHPPKKCHPHDPTREAKGIRANPNQFNYSPKQQVGSQILHEKHLRRPRLHDLKEDCMTGAGLYDRSRVLEKVPLSQPLSHCLAFVALMPCCHRREPRRTDRESPSPRSSAPPAATVAPLSAAVALFSSSLGGVRLVLGPHRGPPTINCTNPPTKPRDKRHPTLVPTPGSRPPRMPRRCPTYGTDK